MAGPLITLLLIASCQTVERGQAAGTAARVLVSRTSERAPEWVKQNKEDPTGEYQYFRGVKTEAAKLEDGLGDARIDAIKQIVQFTGLEVTFLYKKERNEYEQKILEEINAQGQSNVIGAKESESYWEVYETTGANGGVAKSFDVYALIKVPTSGISSEIDRRTRESCDRLTEAAAELAQASSLARDGFFREAAARFARLASQMEGSQVSCPSVGLSSRSLSAKAQTEIDLLRKSIDFTKQGDNQITGKGESLDQPLGVTVAYKWDGQVHPVEGVDVRFTITQGRALTGPVSRTDSQGRAAVQVSKVEASGVVTATVDLAPLFPDTPVDVLAVPFLFTVQPTLRSTTRDVAWIAGIMGVIGGTGCLGLGGALYVEADRWKDTNGRLSVIYEDWGRTSLLIGASLVGAALTDLFVLHLTE